MASRKSSKVFGFGVNDLEESTWFFDENGKRRKKPLHRTWYHILERSKSAAYKDKYKTYKDCEICDDWLYLSRFKLWYDQFPQSENLVVDKDFMSDGSKLYSPDTCIMVSPSVNAFLTDSGMKNGKYRLGTSSRNGGSKFTSKCSDGTGYQKYLGIFDNVEDAHEAWRNYKEIVANRIIEDMKNQNYDENLYRDFYKRLGSYYSKKVWYKDQRR